MFLAEDNEMIKAFPLDGLHETLGEGVHVQTSRRGADGLYSIGFKDFFELRGKLGIAVEDQMRGLLWSLAGNHREVASLLGHPNAVWVRCHARDKHAARADMNEEQHEHVDEALGRDNAFREKVAGPERLDVPADEIVPGAFASFWPKAFLSEDVLDRLLADANSEFLEFTVNLAQAPVVLAGEAQDEFLNLVARSRPAPFANRLRAGFLVLAQPTFEGAWRDNSDQMLDRRAARLARASRVALVPQE